jgi:hypothetical protein
MTDYTELKQLLDACLAEKCAGPREFRDAVDALFDVCSIETIAALVSENERLTTACVNAEGVITSESKSAGLATGRANLLEGERDQLRSGFKNFHRSLCERFGYFHDEIGWQRDQVSLEEHIATQFSHVSAENTALRGQVESLQRGAGQLQEENEALREEREGKVLVSIAPSDGLLMSMAIRSDHALGCPGYYDQKGLGRLNKGVSHARMLESALGDMRKLHEEVVGTGFYSPEKESDYQAMAEAVQP